MTWFLYFILHNIKIGIILKRVTTPIHSAQLNAIHPKYPSTYPHPPIKIVHLHPRTQPKYAFPTLTHHHLLIENVHPTPPTQNIYSPTSTHHHPLIEYVHPSPPAQNIPPPSPTHPHRLIQNVHPPSPTQHITPHTPSHP